MIRDILLQCDAGDDNSERLQTVFAFAKQYSAHVRGVFVLASPVIPSYAESFSATIPYSAQDQIAVTKEQATEAEKQFLQAAEQAKVEVDWHAIEDGSYETVVALSRYADLVILPCMCSRFASDDKIFIADEFLVHSGRPLLLIPNLKKQFDIANNILIAWDESREAARSIHDALPILKNADNIFAISIDDRKESEERFLISGHDLEMHLNRHKLPVELKLIDKGGVEVGEKLLSTALEQNADLIVMGGYSHSRVREIILGGVTDYILRNTTIPLFISH